MCVECGSAANGQECDFCGELICDNCVLDLEGVSNNMVCSEDCARDLAGG